MHEPPNINSVRSSDIAAALLRLAISRDVAQYNYRANVAAWGHAFAAHSTMSKQALDSEKCIMASRTSCLGQRSCMRLSEEKRIREVSQVILESSGTEEIE